MKIQKLILIVLFALFFNQINAQKSLDNTTALLIIDIQLFYFPGGQVALFEPEKASKNAKKILNEFRNQQRLVIHVRHNSKTEGEIHEDVKPIEGEKVISKDEANSFNGTDLLDYLQEKGIKKLVICGMQTHMCVEAVTRAAYDLGFECTVIEDACATRDIKYGDTIIKAEDVHKSTFSSLKDYYAKIFSTEKFLRNL